MSHRVKHDIDLNVFTSNTAIGGSGGFYQTFVNGKGAFMNRIQIWKRSDLFRGVEMWMSDGTSRIFGNRNEDSRPTSSFEIDVAGGEKVTFMAIVYTNCGSGRVGGIRIETDKKRKWSPTCSYLRSQDQYAPPVGSGLICGMFGSSGADVDNLGFALLRKIKTASLLDVKYIDLDAKTVSTTPITVTKETFKNETDVQQSLTISGKQTMTVQRTWSCSVGMEVGMDVSVKAGIPEVGSLEMKGHWIISETLAHSKNTIETEEKSWTWLIVCPPNTEIQAEGNIFLDRIDTKYTAKMQMELDNGKLLEYPVDGVYTGATVRKGDFNLRVIRPDSTEVINITN